MELRLRLSLDNFRKQRQSATGLRHVRIRGVPNVTRKDRADLAHNARVGAGGEEDVWERAVIPRHDIGPEGVDTLPDEAGVFGFPVHRFATEMAAEDRGHTM